METEGVSVARPSTLGKILYGFLFVVVLPVLLVVWAWRTEESVRFPAVESLPAGSAIAICGFVLMILGMLAITIHGQGLPMNAYPPARFVSRGIYRFLPHPIYTGFSILCVGSAIFAGSSSGLWLVSTVVVLGSVALIEGLERHDLSRRFGADRPKPMVRIAECTPAIPGWADRLSVYLLALIPWLLMREAIRLLGTPADTAVVSLPFEANLAVIQPAVFVYTGGYLFLFLAPLIAFSRCDLRKFAVSGLLLNGFLALSFVAFPFPSLMRPFSADGLAGQLLDWERSCSPRAAVMLASYIAWMILAARAWSTRFVAIRPIWYGCALLVAVAGIACGVHSIVDAVCGLLMAAVVVRARGLWDRIRRSTEATANSWREWRFGPIRVINHGLPAGIGSCVGLLIVGTLIGPGHIPSMLIIALSILITSALWAQVIEGSPSLLRPYGWYGGMLGAIFGVGIAALLGDDPWMLLAAFCVAAPWIQSAGRVRCLVQGCCHGRAAPAEIGICITHPRSRVVRLSPLAGIPIHPTPLYSILWNVVIAAVMARLWLLHAQISMIVGVYLILGGLGRFVEESYRGEPQTKVLAGLRLYQWLSVTSVLLGVFLTMIPTALAPVESHLDWGSAIAAACFGLLICIALGVDFPDSNRRFARLA